MAMTGSPILIGQSEYVSSATQLHQLGARGYDDQGRIFRYAKAGVADLVAGNALQGPVWPTDQAAIAVAANAAIGDKTLTLTNGGANAVTANQYASGYMVIEVTPGLGYTYPINSNSAAGTGATITLTLKVPLQVALTAASSKVSLHLNPYNGVLQAPITTLTGPPAGVATYIIKAGEYGWIGSGGTFGTLVYGTPAVFNAVSMPAGAAGSVAINSGTLAIVGYMRATGVNGYCIPVRWVLD
jgi:hypothetical protein